MDVAITLVIRYLYCVYNTLYHPAPSALYSTHLLWQFGPALPDKSPFENIYSHNLFITRLPNRVWTRNFVRSLCDRMRSRGLRLHIVHEALTNHF